MEIIKKVFNALVQLGVYRAQYVSAFKKWRNSGGVR